MDEVAFRPCSIGGRRQEVWGDDDDGSCDYGPHTLAFYPGDLSTELIENDSVWSCRDWMAVV